MIKSENGRLKKIRRIFKNSKFKKGSKSLYEYYVDHKNKNEIELKPHGHQVIKNENGRLKKIRRVFENFESKRKFRKLIWTCVGDKS